VRIEHHPPLLRFVHQWVALQGVERHDNPILAVNHPGATVRNHGSPSDKGPPGIPNTRQHADTLRV
ncbi:MAG: hypothetical protein ACREL5_11055, partial [Gemmatimonadales bacterium]